MQYNKIINLYHLKLYLIDFTKKSMTIDKVKMQLEKFKMHNLMFQRLRFEAEHELHLPLVRQWGRPGNSKEF